MEYIFREKNYKVSEFKTFLTNQLKSLSIETVNTFLLDFIQLNEFEFNDLLSILDRFIDYSRKIGDENQKIFDFVNRKLDKSSESRNIENLLTVSNLLYKINSNYALNYIEENLAEIPSNTKEKISALLLKSDILVENTELGKAFSVLRDCSNQCYDLYIFDALELKRTIYERMAIIGQLENRSDIAVNFYIYYCSFQAGLEFLLFPYLDTYRNFRLPYSVIENPDHEIIQLGRHLTEVSIDINSFNLFLQNFYKNEIPKAFKLENFDIDNFTVSDLSIKDLTYYSSYISKLPVNELISAIELLASQKTKVYSL